MPDPAAPDSTAPTLRDSVLLSIGTLTAVPVPAPRVVDRRSAGGAMVLAPLTGLGLAVPAALIAGLGDDAGLSSLVCAVLVVGALALGTRGLHLDGLADTADGLAASYDRTRALAVMRRGDTGPAGVATLVVVLLLQVAALAQVLAGDAGVAGLAAAVVVSRAMLPLACRRGVPAARPEGLGAVVAESVPVPAAVAVVVLLAVALSVGGEVTGAGYASGPAAALAGALVCLAMLARILRRLGGVTGDVLGAVVEGSFTAALLVIAATT